MTSTGTTTTDAAAVAPYFFPVRTADGTVVQAWTNDPDCRLPGPTLLLCNGLGTNPFAWPGLLDPANEIRVLSWQHRGTGGSHRPVDPARVEIGDFVDDAVAVLEASDVHEPVPVIGWSMGVNTAFELALRHPDRVSGIFAVAGVPGGTFASMLQPLRVPRLAAEALMVGVARAGRLVGPMLTPLTTRLPIGRRTVAVVSHTGFMLPVADADLTVQAIRAFTATPVDWYCHLALHTHRHRRVSLSAITVPVTFVAGTWDVLAGLRDIRTAAERLRDVVLVEVPGTHFVTMEHPDLVHEELVAFLDRVAEVQSMRPDHDIPS